MLPQSMGLRPTPPEQVTLTPGQHSLVIYAVVVAGFALFAGFLHAWNSRAEVSQRYRPAVVASLCITAVATVSYLVIFLKIGSGYTAAGGGWRPTPDAMFTISPRYMDWTVTVPLLTIELLSVSSLVGARLRRARSVAIGSAIAMIATGYLGSQVFQQGASLFWLWLWWAVSMAFFVVLYVVLVPTIRLAGRDLSPAAGSAYRTAATLLLATFLVYPVVYLVPVFFTGGWWTTGMQVAFSAADVVAKVGFGVLVLTVAKIRTVEDATVGAADPDPVWMNGEPLVLDGALPTADRTPNGAPRAVGADRVRR